jgi:hypothetical protein
LRLGELRQLTWGELILVPGEEVAEIQARKQKGKDDPVVVLHPMLAEMLRRHRKECSAAAASRGKGPVRDSDPVFRISSSLLRWLKLDAEFAGVGLTDARGRSTTVHGIRAGFNTTLRRNSTDPALRMRLMRHKTADLTLGTYDKVEFTELRRELERLPVASALALAAGAEAMTVPVTVPSGPVGAGAGRSGPEAPPNTLIAESPNVARVWPSRPVQADAGRSGPVPQATDEMVGPTGFEPASTTTQVALSARDRDNTTRADSTNDSTLLAALAATVREALAAGSQLSHRLRAELVRLLADKE